MSFWDEVVGKARISYRCFFFSYSHVLFKITVCLKFVKITFQDFKRPSLKNELIDSFVS